MRRRARDMENATLKHAHRFIVSRFDNIRFVKRHAIGWLLFVGLLITVSGFQLLGYQRSYSQFSPAEGGTYAEGVVGSLETMNPIFARTPAEQSASRLIFSGLLSYDSTTHLRGELATSWRVEDDGRKYIVDLRDDVYWHDGKKITADDVIYTIGIIKNPLVRSPLYGSWSQVRVTKVSQSSVAFELVRPYAAFPHALTFGILPRHILGSTAPERLRESDFNRQPIGSGAFKFNRFQVIDPDEGRLIVYLERNGGYLRGSPKLERYQLHIFKDSEALKLAFARQEVNSALDLTGAQLQDLTSERPDAVVYRTLISDGMFTFMRNDAPIFSDVAVRKAFVRGTDRAAIIKRLHGYATRLDSPLSLQQLPSSLQKRQASFNSGDAANMLTQAGWALQGDTRYKDGQPMTIELVGVDSGDYPVIIDELKQQWQRLGAKVNTRLVSPNDVQQTVLLPRSYDAFVYELELGVDPDVFAYWHLSQADPRGLNLSNYKSTVASEALSSAQVRLENAIRLPKYELFTDTWINDAPAIALYQPQLRYITTTDTNVLRSASTLANRSDRYRSVELWTVDKNWTYASP